MERGWVIGLRNLLSFLDFCLSRKAQIDRSNVHYFCLHACKALGHAGEGGGLLKIVESN